MKAIKATRNPTYNKMIIAHAKQGYPAALDEMSCERCERDLADQNVTDVKYHGWLCDDCCDEICW